MIKYENQCCGCAVPGYPCQGSSCPCLNVPIYYCDTCNDDTYAEYEIEGEHYCREHAKEYLKEVYRLLLVKKFLLHLKESKMTYILIHYDIQAQHYYT